MTGAYLSRPSLLPKCPFLLYFNLNNFFYFLSENWPDNRSLKFIVIDVEINF